MSAMSSIKCIILEEEMKKNHELKISDIQILKEWCQKQPHLPKISEVQFAIFLHSNYYKIEPTKSTIENYFTMRTHTPEFFSNRDIFKMNRVRQCFHVSPTFRLEGITKEGYIIGMGKLLDFEPSHFDFNDTVKNGFMLTDEFIWTHGSKLDCIFIIDSTGASLGHVARLNPMSLKKFVLYIQDAFPMRIKGIHIINTSPIMEIIINMLKPFINKELMELIYFHSSMESTSKYFPIDVLPNENGGKAGPVMDIVNKHIKKIENFREWYEEDERINRVNESLRIDKSKFSNDLFGMDGSFKKIEID